MSKLCLKYEVKEEVVSKTSEHQLPLLLKDDFGCEPYYLEITDDKFVIQIHVDLLCEEVIYKKHSVDCFSNTDLYNLISDHTKTCTKKRTRLCETKA